ATEQRTPDQLARDAAYSATAHKYWADASTDLARDVSATAYDNELLITGIVPNPQMKETAERLPRQVQVVTRIYNEVQVGLPTNFGQDARDNYVSNALRTQLLADAQVRSSNYTVHTLNGIVYIMGYARNAPGSAEPTHRPLTDDTPPPAAAPRGGPIEVQPIQ